MGFPNQRLKKIYQSLNNPDRILLIIVVASLILGLVIADDFGASFDEFVRYEKGVTAVRRYVNLNIFPENVDYEFNASSNGSSFDMLAALGVSIMHLISSKLDLIASLHFIYFLSFLAGVVSLYFISKRFMGDWAALATSIIFGTQPLLFGHAFINPKDIPFMSIFLVVIVTGMIMVEHLPNNSSTNNNQYPDTDYTNSTINQAWFEDQAKLKYVVRKKHFYPIIYWGIVSITFAVSQEIIGELITNLLQNVYDENFSSPLGRLFLQFAEDIKSVPFQAYQEKAITLVNQYIIIFLLVALLLILARILQKLFPNTLSLLRKTAARQYSHLTRDLNRGLPKKIVPYLKNKRLLLAAILLGLSTSIRILGPAAGGLVAIYYLLSGIRNKTIVPWIAYFSIAALVTYTTWPYLWGQVERVAGVSLRILNRQRPDEVLFNGALYPGTDLPLTYFPNLLVFQLTEPMLFLTLGGVLLVLVRWRNGALGSNKVALLFLWFFLPAIIILAYQPTMYGTIRHSLFIIPPLFIFAGSVFDLAFRKIRYQWVSLVMFAGIILPGIVGIYNLHPYEYIYFNQYVGGVQGAFRRFNLDYWGTSFKEAISYININAEKGAIVYILGPESTASYYLREDIQWLGIERSQISQVHETPTYLLTLTSNNDDLRNAYGKRDLFKVTRNNADLAVVREIE